MVGRCRARPGAGHARERARLLQDGRLPARLDPAGDRRDPAARDGQRLHRDRDRGRRAVHRREPRELRRRRVPLDDRRGARRRAAGGVRALHPGRRRLRRHPRGVRHRVLVAVVRRAGRRLLPHAPARNADRDRRDRGRRRALDHRPARLLDARGRVVQLPAPDDAGRQRQLDDRRLQPARPPREGARDRRRVDLRRGGRQHRRRRPPGRLVLALRRRHLLVHGDGPHAGLVRRARVPRPPARRPAHGRGRRRRLRRAALDAADRGRLREGHARQRDQGADGDRDRRGRARVLHRARPAGHRRPGQPGQRRADGLGPGHAGAVRRRHADRRQLARERAAGRDARARLRRDRAPVHVVLEARRRARHRQGEPAVALHDRGRQPDRRRLRGADLRVDPPAPGVLPHRRVARLRPRRQHLHLHGRQHEPVRARLQPDRRAARPHELGRAAHVGEHEQPERQDPPDRPARGAARPARRGHHLRHPHGQHVRARHRPDAARDLCDGLPQPVPDPRRPGDELGLHGRLRPGRRLDERDPRAAGLGRVQHRQGARLLRLALLRPRERPVPRHHLHLGRRRGDRQRPLQLRRAGQQLAQQHRPDEPAGGQAGDDVDGLHRDRRALPGPRDRRRADRRHRLPLRRGQRLDDEVPALLRRPVVHRRVEQRLDQDRDVERRGPRHGRELLRDLRRLHQPDGHRVRPRRLDVRRRVGPGLRREQPGLGRLPGRLRPGLAAADRAGERHAGRRPRAAGRDVLVRRLA